MLKSVRSLIALALIPFYAYRWSVEAHQAIALIAMKRLTGTSTANRIKTILGTLTLEDIAVCPDQVREHEAHGTALSATCATIFPKPPTGTEQWHFVNTPIKGADFTPTAADVTAACNNNCAVVEIPHFLDVLSSSSATDTGAKKIADQQALSFVVHFIGDIHQPLHSADRDGDAGGNAEHVKFFNTSNVVLHSIWDNAIVAKVDSTQVKLATDLAPEIAKAASQAQGQPMDWALEAYIPARDVAYNGIPAANGQTVVATLGQPYQNAAAPVVRTQIARAGVRLATALQKALP